MSIVPKPEILKQIQDTIPHAKRRFIELTSPEHEEEYLYTAKGFRTFLANFLGTLNQSYTGERMANATQSQYPQE